MVVLSATIQMFSQGWFPLTEAPSLAVLRDQGLLVITLLGLMYLLYWATARNDIQTDGLPVVNRLFSLEPEIFSRIRWGLGARRILAKAQSKVRRTDYCVISIH